MKDQKLDHLRHREGPDHSRFAADDMNGEGLSTIIRAEVFIVLIVWGAIIGEDQTSQLMESRRAPPCRSSGQSI